VRFGAVPDNVPWEGWERIVYDKESEFSSVAERTILRGESSSVVKDWLWAEGAEFEIEEELTVRVTVSESASFPSETVNVML